MRTKEIITGMIMLFIVGLMEEQALGSHFIIDYYFLIVLVVGAVTWKDNKSNKPTKQ